MSHSFSERPASSLEHLLRGAQGAELLRHKLAMLDIEAQHRLGWYRSHFDPNQPRVPAGHPDGGQWTKESDRAGVRLAADERRPFGSSIISAILGEAARRAIERYRKTGNVWDLFDPELKDGTVAYTVINGKDVFGSNSNSPTYGSDDRAAASKIRDTLLQKYPEIFKANNPGKMPANAVFHAETTVLLRAARESGGTLAGRVLEVYVDNSICNNCKVILPKVGLELGNPTVTFVDKTGATRTMVDGAWLPSGGAK